MGDSEMNHSELVGNRGYSTRDVMISVRNSLYLCPSLHQSGATEAEDCFSSVIEDFNNSEGNMVVDLRSSRWWELVKSNSSNLRAKDPDTEKLFLKNLKEKAVMWDEENELVKVAEERVGDDNERFAK